MHNYSIENATFAYFVFCYYVWEERWTPQVSSTTLRGSGSLGLLNSLYWTSLEWMVRASAQRVVSFKCCWLTLSCSSNLANNILWVKSAVHYCIVLQLKTQHLYFAPLCFATEKQNCWKDFYTWFLSDQLICFTSITRKTDQLIHVSGSTADQLCYSAKQSTIWGTVSNTYRCFERTFIKCCIWHYPVTYQN